MHNVSKRKLQQRSLKNLLTRFFNKEKIERYFDQRLDTMVKIVRLFCCSAEMMLELRVLVSTVQVLGQKISQLKGPGFRSTSGQMLSSFSFPQIPEWNCLFSTKNLWLVLQIAMLAPSKQFIRQLYCHSCDYRVPGSMAKYPYFFKNCFASRVEMRWKALYNKKNLIWTHDIWITRCVLYRCAPTIAHHASLETVCK